jgi:hypothetical protein
MMDKGERGNTHTNTPDGWAKPFGEDGGRECDGREAPNKSGTSKGKRGCVRGHGVCHSHHGSGWGKPRIS